MQIAVVRSCAVGDFVLNLPALRALQECDPQAKFTLLGYPKTLEIARQFVNVEAIQDMDREPWRRLFYEPIEVSFDRAIVWMKDPSVAGNLRLSGVPDVFRADPFPTNGHAAAYLLSTLGLKTPELPDLWKPITNRILLHPGSGSPSKCWPHFLELASRLASAAFLIGPLEKEFDTGAYPRLEGLSLPEVSSVLASARAYVGNDSGITHLAGYLGCPTVALFGPTDPRIWGPLGRRAQVLNWPTPDEVFEAVKKVV